MSAAAAGPAAPGVDAVRLLPLPEILRWAIEQGDDGLNVAALVEAVAHDPALAVRALALARETDPTGAAPSDLRASARALGGATLHALVLRASIDWLRGVASGPGQAGLAAWWTHSVESAYLAAALAEALGYARPEQAYLAGLLHDAGMAAHMAQSPAAYRTLLSSSVSEAHLLARESESLGAGHPELGEAIGVQIGLAEPVCDALLLQHANEDELRGTHALVRIVWTAEALTDPTAAGADRGRYARLLDVGADALERACETARERSRERIAALGVSGSARLAPWGGADDSGAPVAIERDAATRAALLDAVLQRALLHQAPTWLLDAGDRHGVLSRARAVAAAAFGLKSLAAFFYDGAKNELTGWRVTSAQLTETGLTIPAGGGASVVSRAWAERGPVVTLAENGSRLRGVDLEIARLLRAQGLIAMPLVSGATGPGVAVFGVGRDQAARVAREHAMLGRWSQLVAASLARVDELGERMRGRQSEAVERMRLGVRRLVHEARNPLSILRTQLELVRERVRSGAPIDRDVQIFKEEIDRVNAILGRLGTLDAEPAPEPVRQSIQVNRALQDLLALYREPLFTGRGIAVRLDIAPQAPEVVVDADGIKQVLVNLWKNAAEAMPRGGQLHIAVTDRVNYEGRLMVEIAISDTGPGIAPELLEAVFTQRPGRAAEPGRGYGLPNSYAIVRQLGGHIMCRSHPGRGTTFTLLLPRSGAQGAEKP